MLASQIFQTRGGVNYLYHPVENRLYRISKEIYELIQNSKTSNPSQSDRLIDFELPATLLCYLPLPISSFRNNEIDRESANYAIKLTLCVTKECNFRCTYCVFSGSYSDLGYRFHSFASITIDCIKKIVDRLYSKHNKMILCFYGGEPLLRIDIISETVEYIRKTYPTKEIVYSVTTNGSLLRESNLDFLLENNFIIHVSIDGNAEIHDKNRRFVDGSGSFNAIIDNLISFKVRAPSSYDSQVFFKITYENEEILKEAFRYFSSNRDLFNVGSIQLSQILNSTNTQYFYDNSYLNNLMNSAINKMTKSYRVEEESDYLKEFEFKVGQMLLFDELRDIYVKLSNKIIKNLTVPFGGACNPCEDIVFIDTTGDYYFCEKMPSANNSIGNAETGIIDELKTSLVNRYHEFLIDKCRMCWAVSLCRQCYFTIKLSESDKNGTCQKHRDTIYADLQLYCEIIDNDSNFFNRHYAKFELGV
jgi:uncharacterized protein